MIATLYDVSVAAINQHLKKIFDDGELESNSVIKKYLITAADGENYNTNHYNLQAVIAVGFKVNNDERSFIEEKVKQNRVYLAYLESICNNGLASTSFW